jgi:hypothetical protein
MGHLFNLQHTTEASYLASSPAGSPFDEASHFKFTSAQRQALSSCSTSSSIWPGGSDFGDTGPFATANGVPPGRRAASDELELQVALPQGAFWPFEPVELDVELRVRPGVGRTFRVQDRLDAGYEEFRIWVEEPTGERRIYRPPRRYCAAPGVRTIGPGSAFRRDISLFGESGGFTFRRTGVHRLWAEFMVRRGSWLISNVVECEILPADDTRLYADARRLLTRGTVSRLLYHRRIPRRARVSQLEDFIRSHPDWSGVGRVEYGVGRALLNAGGRRSGAAAETILGRGVDQLRRVADRPGLGDHQRRLAAGILEAMRHAR